MKTISIMKTSLITAAVVVCIFLLGLYKDASSYAKAVEHIEQGEYTIACATLSDLEGYRDSELLINYCNIMESYNSLEYSSVFTSYRALDAMENELNKSCVSNRFNYDLEQIKALYTNPGLSICTLAK